MSEEPERWPPAADEAEVQRRMQGRFHRADGGFADGGLGGGRGGDQPGPCG
jgi:hypothetical protein